MSVILIFLSGVTQSKCNPPFTPLTGPGHQLFQPLQPKHFLLESSPLPFIDLSLYSSLKFLPHGASGMLLAQTHPTLVHPYPHFSLKHVHRWWTQSKLHLAMFSFGYHLCNVLIVHMEMQACDIMEMYICKHIVHVSVFLKKCFMFFQNAS